MVRWAHSYLRNANLSVGTEKYVIDADGVVSGANGDDPSAEAQAVFAANPEFKRVTVAAKAAPKKAPAEAPAKAEASAEPPAPKKAPAKKPAPKKPAPKKAPAKKGK